MAFVSQIGSGVIGGLEYLGALADLGGKAAYYTFIAPFQGKPVRLQRAVSQALEDMLSDEQLLELLAK